MGNNPEDLIKKLSIESLTSSFGFGGPGGIRTPYLLTASQTFSQVNYGPVVTLIIYHKNGITRKIALFM